MEWASLFKDVGEPYCKRDNMVYLVQGETVAIENVCEWDRILSYPNLIQGFRSSMSF